MRTVNIFLIITLCAIVLFPGTVMAFNVINVVSTPKSPTANEEVHIRLESFTTDLGSSAIAWYVNKVKLEEGLGLTEVKLVTGDWGEQTVVDIVIVTSAGERVDKQIVLAPAEVDLLWEAQTFTPPFYKGKALPSFKSNVRVTAIPRFNSLTSDPKKYHYKWTYNRNLGVGEGVGRNSAVVPMGYDNTPLPVEVEVTLPGTAWKGAKNMDIYGAPAKVVLYQQSPLLGINFGRALRDKVETSESEFVVYAAPFFFSLDDLVNHRVAMRFEVDRRYVSPGLDARYLTIENPIQKDDDGESVRGSSPVSKMVSFSAQNPARILQDGFARTTITFNP